MSRPLNTMDARVLNVYNNIALPDSDLQGSWGNAFHITIGDRQVLFDVGFKGKVLMHNIRTLDIDPDSIDQLVLSHGHFDHTEALPALLRARSTPLRVIAHPAAMESRHVKLWPAIKLGFFRTYVGIPKLGRRLRSKLELQLTRDQVEVLPGLHTTGEIPLEERPEKPGVASGIFHRGSDGREPDRVLDDLSLVLRSREGLVIFTGCCHAGLLNTCAKAKRMFGENVHAVVGGTHMLEYTGDEVDHVADVLEGRFGMPDLYLNHCTGERAIKHLRERFGPEKVRDCYVGTELVFPIAGR